MAGKWTDVTGGWQVKSVEVKNLEKSERFLYEQYVSYLTELIDHNKQKSSCYGPMPNIIKMYELLSAAGDEGAQVRKIGSEYFKKAREEALEVKNSVFENMVYMKLSNIDVRGFYTQDDIAASFVNILNVVASLRGLEGLGLISERKRNEEEKIRPAAEKG